MTFDAQHDAQIVGEGRAYDRSVVDAVMLAVGSTRPDLGFELGCGHLVDAGLGPDGQERVEVTADRLCPVAA